MTVIIVFQILGVAYLLGCVFWPIGYTSHNKKLASRAMERNWDSTRPLPTAIRAAETYVFNNRRARLALVWPVIAGVDLGKYIHSLGNDRRKRHRDVQQTLDLAKENK